MRGDPFLSQGSSLCVGRGGVLQEEQNSLMRQGLSLLPQVSSKEATDFTLTRGLQILPHISSPIFRFPFFPDQHPVFYFYFFGHAMWHVGS